MDMTLMLVVVLLAVAVVAAVYLSRMRKANGGIVPEEPCQSSDHTCSGCCGGTSCFNAKIKNKPLIVYFEDEELDRFRGRNGEDYSAEEIREWQEVLRTILPEELAAWSKSIHFRRLLMPRSVVEELERRLTHEA